MSNDGGKVTLADQAMLPLTRYYGDRAKGQEYETSACASGW